MPSKTGKRPVDEARSRLTEKLHDVRSKTQKLFELITELSNEAIKNAESALKETSKTMFLHKYTKSSQELERCLNKLLLITDITTSGDDEDEDSTTKPSPTLSSGVLSKHASQESLFSSASTAMHSSLEEDTITHRLDEDVVVDNYKWESDVPYPVIVTNILTPWKFSVLLVDSTNDMEERLCVEFMKDSPKGYRGGISHVPVCGTFCCAKSSNDEAWYRAKVTEIIDIKDSIEDTMIKVHFIDEGFEAVVTLSSVRPLDKKFASLPAQSFTCVLGGIQPFAALDGRQQLSFKDCNNLWRDISINWFKEFTCSKIFTAYFYIPPEVAYGPPHNVSKEVVVCDLFITTTESKGDWWKLNYYKPPIQNHLGFIMAVEEIAVYCGFFKSELNTKKSQRILKESLEISLPKGKEAALKESRTKLSREANGIERYKPTQFEVRKEVRSPVSRQKMEPITVKSEIRKTQRRYSSSSTSSIVEDEKPRQSLKSDKHQNRSRNRRRTPDTRSKNNKESVEKNQKHCKTKNYDHDNINFKTIRKTKSHQEETNEKQRWNQECLQEFDNNDKKVEASVVRVQPETDVPGIDVISHLHQSTKTLNEKETINFVFGDSFPETTFVPTERNGFSKIFVSEVINPGLFYCHLVTLEATKLDRLMDELNATYNKHEHSIRKLSRNINYAVGTPVVSRFSEDRKWYRGKVITKRNGTEYNVLHVDFGSNEWINEDCLLPVCKTFCEVPMETIPCCLADIMAFPSDSSCNEDSVVTRAVGEESGDATMLSLDKTHSNWSDLSIKRTRQLLKENVLIASLKVSERNHNGLYEVYVYDTSKSEELFINQLLVDEGLVSSESLVKQLPVVCVSELQLEKDGTEEDALAEWDPMAEQYLSKRNAYSVNVDDLGVAVLGYVEKERDVCIYFAKHGYCYRGDSCRYLHPKTDHPSSQFMEVLCDNALLETPDVGDWVPITVSALYDPTHFWAILPYGINVFDLEKSSQRKQTNEEALLVLNEQMNDYYTHVSKRKEKIDLTLLAEGELVACKFQDDNTWYRARIVHYADETVKVFYIDYGNTEIVTEDDIRRLLPEFLHFPHQAIECFLHETELLTDISINQQLYENIRNKFRDLTANKVLMAHIINRNEACRIIVVDLYDTATVPNLSINNMIRSWEGVVTDKKKSLPNKFDPPVSIAKKNLMKFIPG